MDRCAKCGGIDLLTRYKRDEDRLAKKCKNCEYIWQEDPLDKQGFYSQYLDKKYKKNLDT